MVKPLPGSREPELPTLMLPSEQNPDKYEEHFVLQEPDHPYRRAAVKQELADVRRSHRLDVHWNAYESKGEQICKTGATSSVEKLSIKSIFNVHTVLASLPATTLRVNPELYETKFGTRTQEQGASVHVGQQDVEDASWSSCSRPNKPALLHSRRPCPNLGGASHSRPHRALHAQIALNCRRRRAHHSRS